jgi:hypothetical protein
LDIFFQGENGENGPQGKLGREGLKVREDFRKECIIMNVTF